MKNVFLLFVSFFLISNAFACINEYRTLLSGEVVSKEPGRGKIWLRGIDSLEIKEQATQLLSSYEKTDSLAYYSDYAAALTYLGEYEKAKQVYEEIELKSPGLYTTASNLGTIYELMGEPEKALFWIKKSVEINPDSHDGSEWIHIKILEYKLSGQTHFGNSILGLNFGEEELPSNPENYILNVKAANIWHQLWERTKFVKPQNQIVGSLYFDLGNILAQTEDVETALESYSAAKEYGFTSELMDQRITVFKKLAKKAKRKAVIMDFLKENFVLLFFLGLAALLVGLLFLLLRLLRKKKSNL